MSRLQPLVISALVAALAIVAPMTLAAGWPDKPVKVIVPFGPGGTTDVFARLIQRVAQDQKLLPQPLTIINVGGHFSVGSNQVKNAPPDGYTFLVVHLALLSGEIVDPGRKLSYRDFEPVALTGGFCLHPVVREDASWKSLQELLAAAKEKPSTIIFGVNVGALNHLGGGMLEAGSLGAKFRFVQIGGGAENFAALKGGNTQASMLSSSEYQNFKSGGVRALAYTGKERLKLEPNIPTTRELGLNFDFCINNFWFAPKGTPKEAIDGMADMLQKAMARPEVREAQAKQASTTDFMAGEAFRKHLDDSFARIEPVAKSLVTK